MHKEAKRSPVGPSPGLLPWLVRDAPEYEARKKRTQFVPPTISIKDVHAAVPRHLFEKSTAKSLFYVGRHVGLSVLFYVFATRIDRLAFTVNTALGLGEAARGALCWALWALYWFWQSVAFAGMWTLGVYAQPLRPHRLANGFSSLGHEVVYRALTENTHLTHCTVSAATTRFPRTRG